MCAPVYFAQFFGTSLTDLESTLSHLLVKFTLLLVLASFLVFIFLGEGQGEETRMVTFRIVIIAFILMHAR